MSDASVMDPSETKELLSQFDVESSHSIQIAAPASVVYEVARNLDLSESLVVRGLFALRCMPPSALKIDGLSRMGFKVLREDPGREFALGLIGQFWTLSGGLIDFDPHEFATFDKPGFAKATWSFQVRDDVTSTCLTTVTRVQCLDWLSNQRFKRYWTFIRPFSALVRREALRIAKQTSEARAVHVTRGPASAG